LKKEAKQTQINNNESLKTERIPARTNQSQGDRIFEELTVA
jgi:hypothetical protein